VKTDGVGNVWGRPPGGPVQRRNFSALKAMKTALRTWETGKKLQECQESRFADKKGLEVERGGSDGDCGWTFVDRRGGEEGIFGR
jgi:hypothetical protein